MNDDKIPAGAYCVSTSNRNFEGRQGPGRARCWPARWWPPSRPWKAGWSTSPSTSTNWKRPLPERHEDFFRPARPPE
ncbi:hypothetical protein ACFQT0_18095 [Hymenobacter humi]|uniref:Uncharacterized protein n=1 Tax=Hymenobacter humi TaxID=1411620 RepID=A0ABW2U999_9BACT